jgi:transcriptional regulator
LDTFTVDNNDRIVLSNVEASSVNGDLRMDERADLLQGTLDLLILKTLLLGPLHGWGISKRLRELSSDVFDVGQGSLYPALYRLEDRGWIRSEWGVSPEGRRAKFYTLSAAGKKRFAAERSQWRLFAGAVERVLEAT